MKKKFFSDKRQSICLLLTAALLCILFALLLLSNGGWQSVLCAVAIVCVFLLQALYLLFLRQDKQIAEVLFEIGEFDRKEIARLRRKEGIEGLRRWMRSILKKPSQDSYEKELLKNRTRVAMLQAQINPHFLYNTLDCIRGEAISIGALELADMTKALSNFFSYSINKSGDLVTVGEELESIRNYFVIQRFRFNNRFELLIEGEPENERILDNTIPKLTLQPIVENAILHAFGQQITPGHIRIRLMQTDRRVIICCSDDGCGMSIEKMTQLTEGLNADMTKDDVYLKRMQGHGIALDNINKRIKLLLGEDYGITVASKEGMGTDVFVSLPLSNVVTK